jgi:hypothetical protein
MRLGRHLLALALLGALPAGPGFAEAPAPAAHNAASAVHAPSRGGGPLHPAGNAKGVASPKGTGQPPAGGAGMGMPMNLEHSKGRETPAAIGAGAIKSPPASTAFKAMARTPSPAPAPKLGVGSTAQISGTGMRAKGSGPARIGPAAKSGGHISGNDIILKH